MAKPKGKTPSLLSKSTGTPTLHVCGKATACKRCNTKIKTGEQCFRIPKQQNGFAAKPTFCISCTRLIVEKTKSDILAVEQLFPAIEAR